MCDLHVFGAGNPPRTMTSLFPSRAWTNSSHLWPAAQEGCAALLGPAKPTHGLLTFLSASQKALSSPPCS